MSAFGYLCRVRCRERFSLPAVSCQAVVSTSGDLAGGRLCSVFREAQLAEEKVGLRKETTDVSELHWLPVESGPTPHTPVTLR